MREVGINSYERTKEVDGLRRPLTTGKRPRPSGVRCDAAWTDAAQKRKAYDLAHMIDERPRLEALFALARAGWQGRDHHARQAIDAVLELCAGGECDRTTSQ